MGTSLKDRPVRFIGLERPWRVGRSVDHQQAVVEASVALGFGVIRIKSLDAIGRERVRPELNGERANGHRPNTRVVLGHFDIGCTGPHRPGAAERHIMSLGGTEAEGHCVVGANIR